MNDLDTEEFKSSHRQFPEDETYRHVRMRHTSKQHSGSSESSYSDLDANTDLLNDVCADQNDQIIDHNKLTKQKAIEDLLIENSANIDGLRQMAISKYGLISDDIRRKAWPKLVNADIVVIPQKTSSDIIAHHKDYDQVTMDVNRSLSRFPPGINEEYRADLQDKLTQLIIQVLIAHPHLSYYQGYHDICVTVLLSVGEELAFPVIEKLTLSKLSTYMEKTMEHTVEVLNYILPIVGRVNPQLRNHLESVDMGTVYAVSWLITWMGHDLANYEDIVRLYDFFLASDQLMPIYFISAIILHRSKQLLVVPPDMAELYCALSNLPNDLPFEELIAKASSLMALYPPQTVEREAKDITKQGEMRYKKRTLARRKATVMIRKALTMLNFFPFNRSVAGVSVAFVAIGIFYMLYPLYKKS